jgi:WD40 repeat protein
VSYNGLRGWTAETRIREGNAEYYVEPLPMTAPLPTTITPIDATNMTSVVEVGKLQGNFSRDVAWSITNNVVTVGELGSEGVWVYAADQLGSAPRTLPSIDFVTRVTFSAASVRSNIALLGDTEGSVRLWNLADGAETVERAFLQGHNTQVKAVAFNPSGDRIASSGGFALVG